MKSLRKFEGQEEQIIKERFMDRLMLILRNFTSDQVVSTFNLVRPKLPTQHSAWVDVLHPCAMINDNVLISNLFRDQEGVFFLCSQTKEGDFGREMVSIPNDLVFGFLKSIGASTVSEKVSKTPSPFGSLRGAPTESFFEMTFKAFARYCRLADNIRFEVIISESLEVEFDLCGVSQKSDLSHYVGKAKDGGIQVNLTRRGVQALGYALDEVATLLGKPKDNEALRSYFSKIGQLAHAEDLVQKQLVSDLYLYEEDEIDMKITAIIEDGEVEEDELMVEFDSQAPGAEQSTSLDVDADFISFGVETSQVGEKRKRGEVGSLPPRKLPTTGRRGSAIYRNPANDAFLSINTKPYRFHVSEFKTDERDFSQVQHFTGRLGEELVYRYLKEAYRSMPEFEVVWVNGPNETGGPYDVLVKEQRPDGLMEDRYYIEVKATRMHSPRSDFMVSTNEWNFAQTHGHKFILYRIGNVRINQDGYVVGELIKLEDPSALVGRGIIRVNQTIRVTL